MLVKEVSFREFSRGYIPADMLLLMDKKTKKEKGLYVSNKYKDEVIEFLRQKEQEKKEKKKKALLDFVGKFGDGKEFSEASHQEIKAKKYE